MQLNSGQRGPTCPPPKWRAALPVAPRSRCRRRLVVGHRQRSSAPRVLAAAPVAHLTRKPEPDDRLFVQRRGSPTGRAQLPVPDHRQVDGIAAVARHLENPKCFTARSHVLPLPGSGADRFLTLARLVRHLHRRVPTSRLRAVLPVPESCAGPCGKRGHVSTRPMFALRLVQPSPSTQGTARPGGRAVLCSR